MLRRAALVLSVLAVAPVAARAGMPVFPEPPAPDAYGRVVLDRHSTKAGVPPVRFEHWRHRTAYSCRPCHVDAGFAMEVGGSEISRASNAAGMHCGTCHDGKQTFRDEPIIAACSASGPFERERCGPCHRPPGAGGARAEYLAHTEGLPKLPGGYVDWEAAEERGLVRPSDTIDGVSLKRTAMRIDSDVTLRAKGTWLGSVTFSHRKHAVWSGCEGCHPEIFPNTKRGSVTFNMADVRAGKYCGVCHRNVAFPVASCKRCHP